MYNPARYKSENLDEAFELMDRYPFATVVSVIDGKPFVSHLPLTPKKVEGGIELIGHIARANPQWKSFVGASVTAVFHGPHTYISPVWYPENDVPTWNYSAAHVSGGVELIEDHDGLIDCLQVLTSHIERHWPSGWEFFVPENLAGAALQKSIVGFKIRAESISFKKKLSQNRSAEDRAGVLKGLRSRKDENSQLVLAEMLEMYAGDGNLK